MCIDSRKPSVKFNFVLCLGCFLGHVPWTVVQGLRRRIRQPAQASDLQPAAAEHQERAEQGREEQQSWSPEKRAEGEFFAWSMDLANEDCWQKVLPETFNNFPLFWLV